MRFPLYCAACCWRERDRITMMTGLCASPDAAKCDLCGYVGGDTAIVRTEAAK